MYGHHARKCYHMRSVTGTHGDVLNVHTGIFCVSHHTHTPRPQRHTHTTKQQPPQQHTEKGQTRTERDREIRQRTEKERDNSRREETRQDKKAREDERGEAKTKPKHNERFASQFHDVRLEESLTFHSGFMFLQTSLTILTHTNIHMSS